MVSISYLENGGEEAGLNFVQGQSPAISKRPSPSQWCVLPSSGHTGKKHAVHVGILQLSIRSPLWVQLDGGGALGWFSDLLQLEFESPFPWSSGQLIASGVVTIPSYEDREVGSPWTPTKLLALYPTGRTGQLA